MSMLIPTGVIQSTGVKLADIAAKMDNLSRQASSLSGSIRSCYYGAGVGSEPGNIASAMSSLMNRTKEKSTTLATAASIYRNTESALNEHANEISRNIQYGYNYDWTSRPDIRAIVEVPPVVVTSRIQVKDPPKQTFAERTRETLKGLYGGVKSAGKKLKASYNNHGRLYDVVEYGKAAVKVGKGIVKIVGAVGTIYAGIFATAATGGTAAPLTFGAFSVALTEIISGANDIVTACKDAAYVYTDQYEMVGTQNALKDYLAEKGREAGAILGNAEAGEMVGKGIYSMLDVLSFAKGMESLGESFGRFNTAVTGTSGYSSVWGESTFQDLLDHEIKMTSTSGIVRNVLGWNPASEANLLYEIGENTYKVFEKGTKMVESMESVAGLP